MNDNTGTEANLLRHFPLALQWDERMQVMAQVIAKALALRWQEDRAGILYPDIDSLPERVLDILAYDFKVDWYDFNYPVSTKRKLIKENVLVHRRQGTVFATKTILDSLYPKSAMEEWFTYGGKPGCFRLNVNVTNSAEDGAVVVYSTEEILRRIATVKRLSAHLEGVSYMVRNAIVVGRRIDYWQYRVPECGTIRCGMWWMRHTLGWSERHRLAVSRRVDPFEISPEISGTLPVIKTPGYSLRPGLRISGRADAHTAQPQFTGMIRSGTEWLRHTLGWSEQAGALAAAGRADAHGITPEFTGTLPELSKLGYTIACGAVRAGGVICMFREKPKEAGAPERTGTWPETATVGHSMAAGAVRTGGGVETFKAAPELTGTLPEEITKGYAIAGALTTGSATDGFKINPEYAGTLPEEAQHGERED